MTVAENVLLGREPHALRLRRRARRRRAIARAALDRGGARRISRSARASAICRSPSSSSSRSRAALARASAGSSSSTSPRAASGAATSSASSTACRALRERGRDASSTSRTSSRRSGTSPIAYTVLRDGYDERRGSRSEGTDAARSLAARWRAAPSTPSSLAGVERATPGDVDPRRDRPRGGVEADAREPRAPAGRGARYRGPRRARAARSCSARSSASTRRERAPSAWAHSPAPRAPARASRRGWACSARTEGRGARARDVHRGQPHALARLDGLGPWRLRQRPARQRAAARDGSSELAHQSARAPSSRAGDLSGRQPAEGGARPPPPPRRGRLPPRRAHARDRRRRARRRSTRSSTALALDGQGGPPRVELPPRAARRVRPHRGDVPGRAGCRRSPAREWTEHALLLEATGCVSASSRGALAPPLARPARRARRRLPALRRRSRPTPSRGREPRHHGAADRRGRDRRGRA